MENVNEESGGGGRVVGEQESMEHVGWEMESTDCEVRIVIMTDPPQVLYNHTKAQVDAFMDLVERRNRRMA